MANYIIQTTFYTKDGEARHEYFCGEDHGWDLWIMDDDVEEYGREDILDTFKLFKSEEEAQRAAEKYGARYNSWGRTCEAVDVVELETTKWRAAV